MHRHFEHLSARHRVGVDVNKILLCPLLVRPQCRRHGKILIFFNYLRGFKKHTSRKLSNSSELHQRQTESDNRQAG